MSEKKGRLDLDLTANDLKYILEVNQKAIELYIAVENHNEQIIGCLEKIDGDVIKNNDAIKDSRLEIKPLVDIVTKTFHQSEKIIETANESHELLKSIDKNLFRLVIVFSSGFIGSIVAITIALIQFLSKK
jgi:hypothetical protein